MMLLSTIMQFRWSTNCVLLTPRHQPGNKSLVSTYYQPWMFTLWSGSSENTLLEIVSPFQMILQRTDFSSVLGPSPKMRLSYPPLHLNIIFTIQFGPLNLSSLASPKLRWWILQEPNAETGISNESIGRRIFVDPSWDQSHVVFD